MSVVCHYIGVDVAKDQLDIDLGSRLIRVPNNPEGFQRLHRHLKHLKTPFKIICEASGPYHLPLVADFQRRRLPICVANPRQVRDFARSKGLLAKTDRLDARVLSDYGRVMNPSPSTPLPAYWRELAALVDRRAQLNQMITAESNRMPHQHPSVAQMIRSLIRRLRADLIKAERKIEALVASHPDLQQRCATLEANKGVGRLTAVSVLAAMPELGTLNRAQAAALSGTAPFNRDSGTLRGHRSTWGGRTKARCALYMAALVASRHHPVLKAFYQHLINNGKKPKVALTALMRKLIVLLNSQLKSLTPLSP